MDYTEKDLHRCTVCGRIAEWHYVIAIKNGTAFASVRQQPGTRCWAPGEPTSAERHVLSPDFSQTTVVEQVSA